MYLAYSVAIRSELQVNKPAMSPFPPLAHCLRQPTGDSSNVTDANLCTSLFEFRVNALRRFAPKKSGPLATSAFSLRIGFVDGKPKKLLSCSP
jgi:hypothetical protein